MISSQVAVVCVFAGVTLLAVSFTLDSPAIMLLLAGVGGALAGLGAGVLTDERGG